MKIRTGTTALLILGVVLLGAIAFRLLPRTNSQDEDDPVRLELSSRAFKGELTAIRALHELNMREGNLSMAQILALQGALANDEQLRSEYVQYFRHALTPEQQQRALSAIRQSSGPGMKCLVEILENPTSKSCLKPTR